MNPYMHNQIRPEFNILYTLRKKNPLVICITNDVVRTFSANGLLAIGASPIMSECQVLYRLILVLPLHELQDLH